MRACIGGARLRLAERERRISFLRLEVHSRSYYHNALLGSMGDLCNMRGLITRYINDIALVEMSTAHGRISIVVGVPGSSDELDAGKELANLPLSLNDRVFAWEKAKAAAAEFLRRAEGIDPTLS